MSEQLKERQSLAPNGVYYEYYGEPLIAETPIHFDALLEVAALLKFHFRDRPDVGIFGDVYLYYREGDPTARRAPDLMVIMGLRWEPDSYTSVRAWEGDIPCFILEVTSNTTVDVDIEDKFRLYQELGVKDYFLFDPTREWIKGSGLLGYRLISVEDKTTPPHVNGTVSGYERIIPDGDDGVLSTELGIRFVPHGKRLELYRTRDGRRLLDLPSAMSLLAETRSKWESALEAKLRAEQQVDQLVAASREAKEERDAEAAAREAAEQALRDKEAERLAAEQAKLKAEQERHAEAAAREAAEQAKLKAEQERQAEAAAREAAEQALRDKEAERLAAEQAKLKAEQERQAAVAERERIAALLRKFGIDPHQELP